MKTKLLSILLMLFSTIFVSNAQKALNFDGVNDYVVGTNNNSLNLSQGTIEAWIKTSHAGSGIRGILVKPYQYGIALKDNTLVVAEWGQGEKNTNIIVADNTWHHVAFSFNNMVANGSKLYIDGLPVLSFTYQVSTNYSQQILAGASSKYQQYFNGAIDQVRVWNIQKSDTEILANYNKCLVGTETGLVMFWDFNEGTGTTATDLSANGNNGTLTNMNTTTNWVSGQDCNLVAYYPFNSNANDESGNGNHGTVYGATPTTDRFGNPDSAYSFDGVDDYIKCINPGPLGNTSRTISFWAKTDYHPNDKAGNVVLTYGVDPSSFDYGGRFDIELNSKIVGLGFEVAGGELAKSFDNLDNYWHFYAVVFDNTTGTNLTDAKLYADGNLLTNQAYYNNVNPVINTKGDNPIHIGTLWDYSGVSFKGFLDELKIYNKTLTIEEIKNEYNNLIAFYPFNGNANDESGNNLHGTVNGATLTTDRFGNPDSAYSFDGNDIITIAHNDILNCSDELSISVWVKPNTIQDAMILGKSNYSNATNYVLRTTANNFIEYAHKTRNFSNNNPLNIGQWNHIAVISYSTGERKIYMNNNLTTFSSQTDSYGLVSNELTIGAAFHFGSYFAEFFNGNIDDLSIYKSALSEQEVLNLYNNGSLSVENYQLAQNNNFYVMKNTLYFNKEQDVLEAKHLTVYNILAQRVFQTKTIQNELALNFLGQGIYIIKVEFNNGNISTKKIVIQ